MDKEALKEEIKKCRKFLISLVERGSKDGSGDNKMLQLVKGLLVSILYYNIRLLIANKTNLCSHLLT